VSDDYAYNPDWWREEKALSLARKQRRVSTSWAQPGDSFLIVTEGTVAEPVYFNLLRNDLHLSIVRIKVQPGVHSDPRHVINTAASEANAQIEKAKRGKLSIDEPEKFDHVWAVIDTDVAVRLGFWNDVVQLADSNKVELAHSSPCFEFWLLLHKIYTTRTDLINGDAAKSALKHTLGREYATNAETITSAIAEILPNWPQAVVHGQRVSRYHEEAGTRQPANPSTKVWRLVAAMNDSAPEHLRKTLDSRLRTP
jgi:hypothetical protein